MDFGAPCRVSQTEPISCLPDASLPGNGADMSGSEDRGRMPFNKWSSPASAGVVLHFLLRALLKQKWMAAADDMNCRCRPLSVQTWSRSQWDQSGTWRGLRWGRFESPGSAGIVSCRTNWPSHCRTRGSNTSILVRYFRPEVHHEHVRQLTLCSGPGNAP
jgi:hypothetical protein